MPAVAARTRHGRFSSKEQYDDAGAQAVDRFRGHERDPVLPAARRFAGSGQPSPWQLGFQQAATPVMDDIVWFHDFLLWLITAITLFVLVLLLIVIVRFNARANPMPSRTTHNTLLEVIWTWCRC